MNRVKELRKEQKITQEKLAASLGISRSAVAMYETGKCELSNEILIACASFFGVSTDYLLGLSDEKKSPASVPPSESAQMLRELCGNLTPEYQDELLRYGQYLLTQQRSQSDP